MQFDKDIGGKNMNCKLVKEIVQFDSKQNKGEKVTITNFYLLLENGEKLRISPNVWEDKEGKKHSNMSVLSAIASDITKLPF